MNPLHTIMTLFKLIHLVAVLIWVGGMFFAYVVLRPAAVEVLQPPERLRLWSNVFRRFFSWVWGAVAAILASGLYMIYLYGGMSGAPRFVHVMLLLGLIMMGIYGYVFSPAMCRSACMSPRSAGKRRARYWARYASWSG